MHPNLLLVNFEVLQLLQNLSFVLTKIFLVFDKILFVRCFVMIRFICRILLISTFFIGLGAIVDKAKDDLFPAQNYLISNEQTECERVQPIKIINIPEQPKIKVIKMEKVSASSEKPIQFQMLLPNIDQLPQNDEQNEDSLAQRKIVVLDQVESFE